MSANENTAQSLTSKVVDAIIYYIIENNLQAGNKLPNEDTLASMLNVGRGTVREAVKALISRNILTIRRGAGTYVSEKYGIADDPLGLTFMPDKRKLALDLTDIRIMIEPEIAMLASQNANGKEVAELEVLCDETENWILSHRQQHLMHIHPDLKYHAKIAQCSHNSVVKNLVPIIYSSIEMHVDFTQSKLVDDTIFFHRKIFEAIRDHNATQARDAMLMHLMISRREVEKANLR